jgi:hypothetical protein
MWCKFKERREGIKRYTSLSIGLLIRAPPLLYPRCGASLRKEEKGLRDILASQ